MRPSFSGINVARAKFWLFVVSGMVSALAGVFWTLRFASARADNGTGLELSVVAAVLLGGVSIFGGRGGLVGVARRGGAARRAPQRAATGIRPANTLTIVTGALLIVSVVGPNVVAMAAPAAAPAKNRRTTHGRSRKRRRSTTAHADPASRPTN